MNADRSWRPIEASPELAPQAGAFSMGTHAGGLIFVSGQVPRDPETGQWEKDAPFDAQAARVFGNLELTLQTAGARLDDVASLTIYLGDINDWGRINGIVQDLFTPPFPARAVVGAQLEGFLIEVSAIAISPVAKPEGSS